MITNNYSNLTILNSLNKANKNINKYQKQISKLASLSSINNVGTTLKDIRMSKYEAQVRGKNQGNKNIQDGVSLIQVASNTLDSVSNIGQRLKELAVKYNSDALSNDDKEAIRQEASEYLKEINNQISDTTFNGFKVFDKSDYYIQTGANQGEGYTIKLDNIGDKLKDITSNVSMEEKPPISNNNPINPPNKDDDIVNPNPGNDDNTTKPDNTVPGNNNTAKPGGTTPPPSTDNSNGSTNKPSEDNNTNVGDKGDNTVNGDNAINQPGGSNSTENYHKYLEYVIDNAQIAIKDASDGWGIIKGENGWTVESVKNNNQLDDFTRIYNEKNELVFEGNIKNGKADEYGTLYKDNKIVAQGKFKDNLISDWGTITYDDGGSYTGTMTNEVKNGWGSYTDKDNNSVYGEWKDDKLIKLESTPSVNNISVTSLDNENSIAPASFDNLLDNKIKTENIEVKQSTNSIRNQSISIEDVLNVDYIDKNILKPVTQARNSLNIQEDILERRTNLNDNTVSVYENDIQNKSISEYTELLKKLSEDNNNLILLSNLYSQSLSNNRDYILQLLS